MWMQKPLLSMHVSCVNLGLQLALFFLQAIRSEKHKVAVKASNPSGQMFVCSLLLCVPVCVCMRERQRGKEEREYITTILTRKTETELSQERNITILTSGNPPHCAV